jgi:hypothetical protein
LGLFDVSCVAHVHSTYSDGTATVPELLRAARDADVDALLLTDHDSLGAQRDGWEGMHDGVFLLVGTEISPKQGHYLAFGVEQEVAHGGRSAGEIAQAVRAAGGIGFAAHPFSSGGHMMYPPLARRIVLPHAWPALHDDAGFDGIELWSLTTDAAESWRTPAAAWRWLRDPEGAVAEGPPAHYLRTWDQLLSRRRVPAIGGLDGHAPGIRLRGQVRSPLSHALTFGLLRTHLVCERGLTGDVQTDRETVLEALREGAAWLTCPFVAPAHGARMWVGRANGEMIPMGGEAEAGSARLNVRLPRTADILVVRDGAPFHEEHADELELEIGNPGVYRTEVRIDTRLWLLSNAICLRSAPV